MIKGQDMYNGYKVHLIKDGEVSLTIDMIEDSKSGGYTVISPDVPEAVTQGETLEEGLKNFTDMLHDIQKYKDKEGC